MTTPDPDAPWIFGDLFQQAQEDGFRHGLGVAIRLVEYTANNPPDYMPPSALTLTVSMLNGIAGILREASANFTLEAQ